MEDVDVRPAPALVVTTCAERWSCGFDEKTQREMAEKFQAMIKGQTDEELNEDLVGMYNNTALLLALLLTIAVTGFTGDGIDAHDNCVWQNHEDTGKAVFSFIMFVLALQCILGIRYAVTALSQLSQIPMGNTREWCQLTGAFFVFKFNVMIGDFTTYTFLLGILVLFSISSTVWLFVPAAIFVVVWILFSEQSMRPALIKSKLQIIRQTTAKQQVQRAEERAETAAPAAAAMEMAMAEPCI